MQCPECNGTGQVTQMGGRMKFNIPCPRCNGTGRTSSDCATCHGEGMVSRSEPVEFRIKAGHARRAAHPPAGQGQRRRQRRRRPGDLFLIVRTGTHPVFTRVGRRHPGHRAGDGGRGLAGRQGGRAHHRRPRAVEDSPRHAERAKAAHARAGRGERAAPGPARRPDCDRRGGGAARCRTSAAGRSCASWPS